MSALPPKADMRGREREVENLISSKRTSRALAI